MLALKYSHQLSWGELKFIEDPMHAIRTVESEHGRRIGGKSIENAHLHDLPNGDDKRFDSYWFLKTKLENGQVFLVNHFTIAPAVTSLDIDADGNPEYTLRNSTSQYFHSAFRSALRHIPVPKPMGVLRDEPKPAQAKQEQKTEPKKEEKKKEPETEYKVSIGIQGSAGIGSSDIRITSENFESPIKINNVDKKYGKIAIDSVYQQNNGHREIALLDIEQGDYYSYLADHTGKGIIPIGKISTLKKEANADFSTALAAIVPMAYETPDCDTTKPTTLRNGYLYVYVNGVIWREIKVDNNGKFKDVDLKKYVNNNGFRNAETHFDRVVLLPAKINGKTPDVQLAFSQCQWTWQRIRQLGGMSSDDIRLLEHPDVDVSAIGDSDNVRNQRMGPPIDISSWDSAMESSTSGDVTALDKWVDNLDTDIQDIVDQQNLDKKVGVVFVKESLHWTAKASLDHQLAWGAFEEYLADLQNPNHTDTAKKEEFKFSPYFESALLAHQYFFAENDDMKQVLKTKGIKPNKRHRGPKRYEDADGLIQAIKNRTNWADQLSLPDIEKALGMQKRAALKDRILQEKKSLLAILDTQDAKQLEHFKQEIADFATLGAREDKHQEWAYDQLWALVGKLLQRLAQLPDMQDNGMDSTPLTMAELNEAHKNDIGHQFVFSILDNKHWLHPLIFPKADPSDSSQPYDEEKSPADFTCDPNKLNHKIEDDRDFEVMRRTSEFISGALMAFMDTNADVIGDAHIQSTVRLIHSQKTGLKLQKASANLGTFLQPQLKAVGLELDIPGLEAGQHQIRVKFQSDTSPLRKSEREFFRKTNLDINSIDIPNSKKNTVATIKNMNGNTLGAVSKEIIESGHGLNPRAWQALSNSKWHTTNADIWVLNDQQSRIQQMDKLKPAMKNAILPMLGVVELWNTGRAIQAFLKQDDIMNDPMVLANLISALADAVALSTDAVKIFQKYAHAKSAYEKGVGAWSKFLMTQGRYALLAQAAKYVNVAASGISFCISLYLAGENIREKDDAWVSHLVMASGFAMLGYAALITVSMPFMLIALGLVLLGAALLKWVFKENDLMKQWLELGPFSKKGVSVEYTGTGGQMRREPSYIVDTDYGKLKLDKRKRLQSVLDMGDFYWEDDKLMLTKLAPLDVVDGLDSLEIGKLNGPVDLDALSNKSERLTLGEYAVVDDWKKHPQTSSEDLASLIFQPDFDLEEKDSDLEVTCSLNGIVSNQAKFEFQLWVLQPRPENHIGRYRPKLIKLNMPDEITQLSGQAYKFIWKDFPVDKHSRYKMKYKIDLYGNGEIKIPGRYDEDGWIEQWL